MHMDATLRRRCVALCIRISPDAPALLSSWTAYEIAADYLSLWYVERLKNQIFRNQWDCAAAQRSNLF